MGGLFKSKHIGQFEVAIEVFNNYPDLLHEVFLDVLPIRTIDNFMSGNIEYIGISERWFEEIPNDQVAPMYKLIIDTKANSFKFEKR